MDGDWSSFGVSQAPDVCSVSGEYFRAQTLTCESCPSGEAVTADGLGCECVGNTIRTSVDPAGTLPSSPYGVCMFMYSRLRGKVDQRRRRGMCSASVPQSAIRSHASSAWPRATGTRTSFL